MVTNISLTGSKPGPCSECDVRFNYNNPLQIVGACNVVAPTFPGVSQLQFYSLNGGVTWQQFQLYLWGADTTHTDPCVDWTSDGKTAWSLTIGRGPLGKFVRAYKSTDAGVTWNFDSTVSGATQKNADKPSMWIDHSSEKYKDTIYVLWKNLDDGQTYINARVTGAWLEPRKISGTFHESDTIGGDIKTNTFGDLFAFWPSVDTHKMYVARSINGGDNFDSFPILSPPHPATFGQGNIGIPSCAKRRALIYISGAAYRTATQNNVYACWMDLAGVNADGTPGCNVADNEPNEDVNSPCTTRIWFSRSTNGGMIWETPRKINDLPGRHDQFCPRLALDETSGYMMVIYYDTVGDPHRLKTDIWMQSSTDDGVTWSTATKITSQQTDEHSADDGADLTNQYGDYIGLTGHAGQFFACWTDRRSGGPEEIWGAPITLIPKGCGLAELIGGGAAVGGVLAVAYFIKRETQ